MSNSSERYIRVSSPARSAEGSGVETPRTAGDLGIGDEITVEHLEGPIKKGREPIVALWEKALQEFDGYLTAKKRIKAAITSLKTVIGGQASVSSSRSTINIDNTSNKSGIMKEEGCRNMQQCLREEGDAYWEAQSTKHRAQRLR